MEGAGGQRAGGGQCREDGILQLDSVLAREVGDVVDIGRRVERGVEDEDVGAAPPPVKRVVAAAAASEDVRQAVAGQRVGGRAAGQTFSMFLMVSSSTPPTFTVALVAPFSVTTTAAVLSL